MSYLVLARKYRPQRFSEVIGQEHVTRTLKNALEQRRLAHGYIFSGHRGIGKTTVARILAMAMNCRSSDQPVAEPCGKCESCTEIRAGNSVDVIEIDAATNRGIDEIRELREAARYRPARDRYKIYILDEAHQITDAAFNALLKTLEEPPDHVAFMLATTQPEDIPQTIRSRCQHFSFHAVRFEEILNQLRDLAGRENITADEDALALLAEAGDGSMRDALSILDQAIASSQGTLTAETVRQLVGAAPAGTLEQVMQAVATSNSQEVLRLVDRLMMEGHSAVHFARQMVRFLRNAVVAKVAGADSELLQISADERGRVGRIAEMFSEEDLTRYLNIMLRTHGELGYKQEQRFHLELGLLKMSHAQRLLPLEQLLSEAAAGMKPGAPPNPGNLRTGISALVAPPARTLTETPRPSPFAADSARKGTFNKPEMMDASQLEASKLDAARVDAPGPRAVAATPTLAPVIMGSAAPSTVPDALTEARVAQPAIQAVAPPAHSPKRISQPVAEPAAPTANASDVGRLIAGEVESAGHPMAASLLVGGQWTFEGNQLVVKIGASEATMQTMLGTEPVRVANAAASTALGRPAKIKLVGGGVAKGNGTTKAATPTPPSGGIRARAMQEPVVKRLQEKFGAEIRTVIDNNK